MTMPGIRPAKVEAFSERFLTSLNNGALCLMTSIGHRTGLFDVLSQLPPATSEEIAAKAGLNERYVREWLGAMVTSGVVEVEPDSGRFALPAEHAAFLTRAAAADNLAVFAQYIGLLGSVEGARVSSAERFSLCRGASADPRHPEQLVRRTEVNITRAAPQPIGGGAPDTLKGRVQR
jgi:hypothetical protein